MKMDTTNLVDIVRLAAEAPSCETLPQDQETRAELLTALRKLTVSLEDPVNAILKLLFQVCLIPRNIPKAYGCR